MYTFHQYLQDTHVPIVELLRRLEEELNTAKAPYEVSPGQSPFGRWLQLGSFILVHNRGHVNGLFVCCREDELLEPPSWTARQLPCGDRDKTRSTAGDETQP